MEKVTAEAFRITIPGCLLALLTSPVVSPAPTAVTIDRDETRSDAARLRTALLPACPDPG